MKHFPWQELESALEHGLTRFRWFGAKSRTIRQVRIQERFPLGQAGAARNYLIALARVEYEQGMPELYAIPIAFASGKTATRIRKTEKAAIFHTDRSGAIAYDATLDSGFRVRVLQFILSEAKTGTAHGRLRATITSAKKEVARKYAGRIAPSRVLRAEQSNTSLAYGSRFILKFYRHLSEGINPDVEIGRFLTDQTDFRHSPSVVGTLEFDPGKGHEPITIGCVYDYVRNQGDAWKVFLDKLIRLSKTAASRKAGAASFLLAPSPSSNPLQARTAPIPAAVKKEFGELLTLAEQLGQRTFQMHAALASKTCPPEFKPERFSPRSAKAFAGDLHKHSDLAFHVLRESMSKLSGSVRKDSLRLLELREEVLSKFNSLTRSLRGAAISRTHGDYHLGQVLFTGNDFVIIDYEGEPARPLAERRRKHPPFRDIAGMLRSFHYAAQVAREHSGPHGDRLGIWFSLWNQWTAVAYLKGYFKDGERAAFIPRNAGVASDLLKIYLLEKALYELVYELNNRPDWVKVPLSGILELLEDGNI